MLPHAHHFLWLCRPVMVPGSTMQINLCLSRHADSLAGYGTMQKCSVCALYCSPTVLQAPCLGLWHGSKYHAECFPCVPCPMHSPMHSCRACPLCEIFLSPPFRPRRVACKHAKCALCTSSCRLQQNRRTLRSSWKRGQGTLPGEAFACPLKSVACGVCEPGHLILLMSCKLPVFSQAKHCHSK